MTTNPTHLWLRGEHALHAWSSTSAPPTLGRYDGHARLRGPFTAVGSLLRELVPSMLQDSPEFAQLHDIEILTAAPELASVLHNERTTLTSEAAPQTRTRYYPHDRMRWIGNGLSDFVLGVAAARGGGQVLVIEGVGQLDATDAVCLAGLLRRSDPRVLRLVLASESDTVPDPLALALERYAQAQGADGEQGQQVRDPANRSGVRGSTLELVRAYVRGACLSTDPVQRAAYEHLGEADRRGLHDEEADRLEAVGEVSLRLGAVTYHREHGSDPARAAEALTWAMRHCLMAGLYDHLVGLGRRLRSILTWESDPQGRWLATVRMTIAHQAMGQPDEAMALFDDACAGSVVPSVHMQCAYGRAMVYTRYYDEARRDLRKAKGLVNTAVALAQLSLDEQRRAYNRTFNENGLALIEMHLGDLDEAVRLIEEGIARLDREVDGGRYLLHRSVLRYNHAQLMVRVGTLERALEEYTRVIDEDPHHPDYYFERAGLLERAGRLEEAVVDYTSAIRVAPPYPEPHYNRADLLLRLGDADGALADFTRVLELEPGFVDAYVNRAALLLERGDLAGAAQDVAVGLELAPQHPHLLALQGQLLHETGKLGQAQASLEAAVAADPSLAAAWANLGAVLFDLGDVAGSCAALEQSLELDDHPDVRENLALARAAA